ncbi:MAG: purine-nucleoside phosphorylase [Chlorobi bacterium]|nr:purine-nucleoside phosphorylase [Chlorobiota bacterium]
MTEENVLPLLLHPLGIVALDAVVILGSGLAGCFADHEFRHLIDAGSSDIPGHTGRLAILARDGKTVLVALGRKHLYEGHSAADAARIVGDAAAFGARELIVTNAAGGLRPGLATGEIMLVDDYIGSLLGRHMHAGAHSGEERMMADRGGRERPALSVERYETIELLALGRGLRLRRGVYAGVTGPSYETRAEIGMLRCMGAAAVGMSTIPEIAEAARRGMGITGLSLITNTLSDTLCVRLAHDDVVGQGGLASGRMRIALEASLDAVR